MLLRQRAVDPAPLELPQEFQFIRTKRSADPIVPGRKDRPLTPFQYASIASCWSKLGELVITVYFELWWITSLPATYSKIALSPEASAIER